MSGSLEPAARQPGSKPGNTTTSAPLSNSNAQQQQPVLVGRSGNRVWWWFEGEFYWESGNYGKRDVLALVSDRQRRAAQRLDRAHLLLNVEEGHSPGCIPGDIPSRARFAVRSSSATAGNARNAAVISTFSMITSYRWPWACTVTQTTTCEALGGATTAENLQLLCGNCNRGKGADL